MKRTDVVTTGWKDYELLDSGEGRKLERFGSFITDRPDPQALWGKSDKDLWIQAQAQFVWADKGERWKISTGVPEQWAIAYGTLTVELSLKGFKHLGIFPEHASQWQEILDIGKPDMHMLNLFGYTGAASIAGALSGMKVTHIDASKTTIATVKENMKLSHVKDDGIRTVCEDALKYAKRLVDRGETFDVIVMDPPAFGRGPKGEVWKIEEKIHELLSYVPKLMSPNAKLVILNGYASGYSAATFGELLQEACPKGRISYGEVAIQQARSERTLTTGIYAKWQK